MMATRAILHRMAFLLATDPGALGNPAVPFAELGIITEPFVESLDLVLSDLTLATEGFDASILACGGPDYIGQLTTPNDHLPIINVVPAIAGFRIWSNTLTTPTLVHGLALIAAGGGQLLATSRFAEPLLFASPSDIKWFIPASFTFGPGTIS